MICYRGIEVYDDMYIDMLGTILIRDVEQYLTKHVDDTELYDAWKTLDKKFGYEGFNFASEVRELYKLFTSRADYAS